MDKPQGTTANAPKARRKRRSTQEVLDLIIDAALVEFGENGYSNTTTAAIARRAEVAEALIFTRFGSKANLFRKAIFKPLDDHFQQFVATHTEYDNENSRIEGSRAFVSELVDFVRQNSGLFKSLVVNEAYSKDDKEANGLRGLQDYFDKMSNATQTNFVGTQKVAPPIISRISFAAILGVILFDDWLFPEGTGGDQEIHEGLCDFIMEGLSVNPGMKKSAA